MVDSSDLRMRGTTVLDVPSLPGTIYPFSTSSKSLLHTVAREMADVVAERPAKKILVFTGVNLVVTVILLFWSTSTNSMALTAYTYLTIFDMFSLLTCLVSVWVRKQKPSPIFSFGYSRFEVLAVFASTLLAQLGALFIVKESVERMLQQPEIHTGRLLVGTALASVFHLVVTYSVDNKAFNHVVNASSSSWLQEHVADMSESICHAVPGLSKLLLPRINPFVLIACAGSTALVGVYLLIDINNYYAADTWAAVWIAMMTAGTMFPMAVYSGKILLQTTPSHILGQLDKCIREASTLDGVLEFRHEHFWTLAFGTMAGSVHVRIRRDADEQMVLAHVANRLSNLVSVMTVQIFKDDWTRPSSYQVLGDTALLSKFTTSGSSLPSQTVSSPPDVRNYYTTLKSQASPAVPNLPYPDVGVGASLGSRPVYPFSAASPNGNPNPPTSIPAAPIGLLSSDAMKMNGPSSFARNSFQSALSHHGNSPYTNINSVGLEGASPRLPSSTGFRFGASKNVYDLSQIGTSSPKLTMSNESKLH